MILFQNIEEQRQVQVEFSKTSVRRLMLGTRMAISAVATYTMLLHGPQVSELSATRERNSARILKYFNDAFQGTGYDVRVKPESIKAMTSQIEWSVQHMAATHGFTPSPTAMPSPTTPRAPSAHVPTSALFPSSTPSLTLRPSISAPSTAIQTWTAAASTAPLVFAAAFLLSATCLCYVYFWLRSKHIFPSEEVRKFNGVMP